MADKAKKVVIVGGGGKMGARFATSFAESGMEVSILEQGDWANAANIVAGASLVLVSVPIAVTDDVISRLPKLPQNCILADLTSVKTGPVAAMMAAHDGPVVGFHPMFGADFKNFNGQVIVHTSGRGDKSALWLIDMFVSWGAKIQPSTPEQHDKAMVQVQALRHFTTFTYGSHLMAEGANIDDLVAFSSPIYRLELAMVGRLFAQDPDLYTEIIFSSADNLTAIRKYADFFSNSVAMLEAGDKQGFKKEFSAVSDWMGDHAKQFYAETGDLIRLARDKDI